MTEKRIKNINNCHKRREDRINLTVPKGAREMIQNHAVEHNESTNQFIRRAISEAIERDKAFAERKEGVINIAKKCGVQIEDEGQLKRLAEAFPILEPQIPSIQSQYFGKSKTSPLLNIKTPVPQPPQSGCKGK